MQEGTERIADVLRELPLCDLMTNAEVETLAALATQATLAPGTVFVHEGDRADAFFVVLEGEIDVFKTAPEQDPSTQMQQRFHVTTETAGSVLGEMALVEQSPRSASLETKTPVTMLRFDIARVRASEVVFHKLTAHIAQQLAKRLRNTTNLTVQAMQRELEQTRSRIGLGLLTVTIVWLLSLYTLGLSAMHQFKQYLPSTTPISIALLLVMGAVTFAAMRRSGYPYRTFGFSLRHWRRMLWQSLLWTIPVLAGVVLLKWFLLLTVPRFAEFALFDPSPNFRDASGNFNWTLYWLSMAAYTAFVPVQEMMARGGLQSSFQLFLTTHDTVRSRWRAILLSNLLFSMTHAHVGLGLAIASFVPGLFWGWMYTKHHSLFGVSVSHILVGVWATFIVGMEHLF